MIDMRLGAKERVIAAACGLLAAAPAAHGQGQEAAQAPEPPPAPPTQPDMIGPLALPAEGLPVRTGLLGTWRVDGVLSGLGMAQNHPMQGDRATALDVSNAQVIVQKPDGLLQVYAQIGAYSTEILGTRYWGWADASRSLGSFYSMVPLGFVKLAPGGGLTVEAGKLISLIGAEDPFTFENIDIDRGLLWGQAPAISRGVQADLVVGPVTLSASLNDGFYSDRFTSVSGSATWALDESRSLLAQGSSNLGRDRVASAATPLPQNNGSIGDVVYKFSAGGVLVTPYVQYGHVPADAKVGLRHAASSYGAAVLGDVPLGVVADAPMDGPWSLGARAEYLATTGRRGDGGTNLLYGPGSSAGSLTLTPTYAPLPFFGRVDLSIVGAAGASRGLCFGAEGRGSQQLRAVMELGVLF